jgi:glycosyltransferase involved in cell wall biosynthesis
MVGGGETAALQTAFGLAKRGHTVAYCGCCRPGQYRGVTFGRFRDFYRWYLTDDWDAVVAWSVARPLRVVKPGCLRVVAQQLNDLGFEYGWWRYVDLVVSPSQTHADYLRREWVDPYGVAVPFAVVHNGVDPLLYPIVPPLKARPMVVGYWSSPDRGLHHVLEAWPLVRREVPDAELHVYYEIDRWASACHMGMGSHHTRSACLAEYVKECLRRAGPGVKVRGAQHRRHLALDQVRTRVLAYPCDPWTFTEGFSCATAEALTAGVLPVLAPVDALPELYDGSVKWLTSYAKEEIAEAVVYGLTRDEHEYGVKCLHRRGVQYTWDAAAQQMHDAILEGRRYLG